MLNETIVIELPSGFKRVAVVLADLGKSLEETARTVGLGSAVDYGAIEREVAACSAALERAAHGDLLQRLDVDAPQVEIGGRLCSRIGRTIGRYKTLAGEVEVERCVYRERGVRNGPTIDPIRERTGAFRGGWMPRAARAMAHQLQQGTSREAEVQARETCRLPYSRSSFERVAHEVGEVLLVHHADIEDELTRQYKVPPSARSVSVSIDRVSVPMEEPRARPMGRPRKNAPKRPVERNFRMAWCGTVTFHDKDGEALHTIRYGRMPRGDAGGMCIAMANEVYCALRQRPDLELVLIADGAHEMWGLLEENFSEEVMGKAPRRMIDFWHVVEKLAPAAKAIHEDSGPAVLAEWRRKLRKRDAAAAEILAELDGSGLEEPASASYRPVHDAMTYFENHGHRLNYSRALRRNLPIGSGNVEATCKSLVSTRMKRPGSRWKHNTGEHIIHLRALALSDRWGAAIEQLVATQRTAVRVAA